MKHPVFPKRLLAIVLCVLLVLSLTGCYSHMDLEGLEASGSSAPSQVLTPDGGGDDAEGETAGGATTDAGRSTATAGGSTTTAGNGPTTTGRGSTTSSGGRNENSTVSNSDRKPGTSSPAQSSGEQNQSQTASKGEDNTVSEKDSGGLTGTDNVDTSKNIPATLKGKTVIFADWGEANAAEYQKVVKKFTADTGIKVKMLVLSESDYISKVSQEIAAGGSPDIVVCNNTFPHATEVVQELPDVFDIYDGFWDPRISEETRVGNKYYFVNTYNSPFTGGYVVYYNKKIYNNNGLPSPEDYLDKGQWTYENLFTCMSDAVKLGYKGGVLEPVALAEQIGISIIDYDPKSRTFTGKATDPKLVKAMQYMSKAVDEGLTGASISNFVNGQVGICMADIRHLKYDGVFKGLASSDIGVVPLPTGYDGRQLTYMPLGYRGYGVCKWAKNPEAAYYFLRYFLDLNKYEPAGAEIFANKVLEKYFRQTQLVLYQNSSLYFEHFKGALSLIGKGWGTSDWTAIRHSSSSQVAIELEKMQSVVDTAAASATGALKAFYEEQKKPH